MRGGATGTRIFCGGAEVVMGALVSVAADAVGSPNNNVTLFDFPGPGELT